MAQADADRTYPRTDRRSEERLEGGFFNKVIRVDRVRKAGKDATGFSALVVVGDRHGKVGFGSGRGKEVPAAIRKGREIALKNMITVDLDGTTIPHAAVGESRAGAIVLKPASEGTGVVAGEHVRTILESAGIRNALTKYLGELDPEIVFEATFDALRQLRSWGAEVWYGERRALQRRLIAVLKLIQAQRQMQEQMDRLISSMLPQTPVPLPPYVLQARRNAAARDALLREFGAMTSADIGDLAGSTSVNRAALAHKWKSDGRIFSVPHQGSNYFPGFQFTDDGQPIAAVADVIRLLAPRLAPWELALWFTRRNGWLNGSRPVDLLRTDAAAVITAAEREAGERVF